MIHKLIALIRRPLAAVGRSSEQHPSHTRLLSRLALPRLLFILSLFAFGASNAQAACQTSVTFPNTTKGTMVQLDVSSCSIPILSGLYEDDGGNSINDYPMVANVVQNISLNSYTFTLQDGAQVSVIPAAVLGGTTNSYFTTYDFTITTPPTSNTASTIPLYYASGSNYTTGTFTTINTAYPITVNMPAGTVAAPVASNVSASVSYDSSGTTIASSVSGSYTSVAIVTAPSHGTATVSGTSFVYTPNAGYDGTDSFTYTATGSGGTSNTATVSISVGSPTITLPGSTLQAGTVNSLYYYSLATPTGGAAPYTFNTTLASGSLPPGLALAAGGMISGTPTTAGTYTFTVSGYDSSTPTAGTFTSGTMTIKVSNPAIALSPASGALSGGAVGSFYSSTITASGGNGGPYTLSVSTAGGQTGLPPGMSWTPSSSNVLISGTPTTVGTYTFTVTATDTSGDTVSAAYSINVTASSVATLSNLTVSSGTLTPAFTSGTLSYSDSVANTVSSITVTPTTTSSYATVTVNGTAVTSGSASQPIALAVGANTIYVTVTAQNGTSVSGYTVTVNRAASSVATLSKLTLSQGTLTPTFASGTTSYSSSVGHTVSSITVTPTTTASTATVKVNGTTVTSGSASAPIALVVGSNKITVVATAQNGTTTDTYTVNVSRASLLDPAKDPGVIALVTAQDQMAKQFANIQIDNFSSHLESLEGNQIPASDFGITLAPTNVAYFNPYDQAPGVPPQTQPGYMEMVGAVPGAMGGHLESMGGFENATAVTPQGRGRGRRVAAVAPARTTPATTTQHKFGFWTGGALEFQQGNSLDLHSNGLSGGVDVRVSRDAIVGFGLGIGEGKTDFTNNSNTNGNSTSEVFYGSVTPYHHAFVSFLAGHSSMRFTSDRTVTGTTVVAHGQRNGQEFFGQIGGGMQYQTGQWLSVPYARVRMISGHLNAFDETASVATDALHYDRLSFSSTRFDLGLRSSFTRSYHFGTLTPQVRVEYDHQVQNQETQGLAYADLMNGPQYVLTLPQSGQNQGRVGLALGIHFTQGLHVSVEYQRVFGSSLSSDLLMAQVASNF